MASIETNATVAGAALDASNDRLSALLANAQNKSAGQLMAEMTKENGISAFAQAVLTKNKDDNKFSQRLA
jgi:hypothetical protein